MNGAERWKKTLEFTIWLDDGWMFWFDTLSFKMSFAHCEIYSQISCVNKISLILEFGRHLIRFSVWNDLLPLKTIIISWMKKMVNRHSVRSIVHDPKAKIRSRDLAHKWYGFDLIFLKNNSRFDIYAAGNSNCLLVVIRFFQSWGSFVQFFHSIGRFSNIQNVQSKSR